MRNFKSSQKYWYCFLCEVNLFTINSIGKQLYLEDNKYYYINVQGHDCKKSTINTDNNKYYL